MFCCLCGEGDLEALAFDFSPYVERSAPNAVNFDASGLDRLFGLPQDVAAAVARRAKERSLKVHIAIASNPDTAICAASAFTGVSVVPYGDEAKFLAGQPVGLLAPSPELAATLTRWGIRSLGELAALPPLGIAERLGPEGLRLRLLARGEARRKLRLLEDPLRFEEELELEDSVSLLDPLLFLLARLLNGLIARLATRALSANELRVRLSLENAPPHERALRLPAPTLDAKSLLKLLRLDLEAHPPTAPVTRVWMAANPVKPRPTQEGLFTPAAPEPVKLELTLARIRAIVGEDRACAVELLDTHRPDSFRPATLDKQPQTAAAAPKPRLGFRMFRPPLAASVSIAASHPSFVAAGSIRGNVLESAGPWRGSGDWWTEDPWERDEWDISLSDGGLYRIYCCPRGWFVEGSYD
jgi:protein ImuB